MPPVPEVIAHRFDSSDPCFAYDERNRHRLEEVQDPANNFVVEIIRPVEQITPSTKQSEDRDEQLTRRRVG